MTKVKFLADDSGLYGFEISGHCSKDSDDETGKTVCAAVSSAAYMAANTVTEIQQLDAEITVNDGFLNLNLSQQDAKSASVTLEGLRLHLTALSQEYPKFIKVKNSEV